jgi:hypothetical protein
VSEENVAIVRAMLEPLEGANLAEIDWDGEAIRVIVERFHSPDVELHTLPSGAGSGPSALYRGWDGLIRYGHEWLEPFSEYQAEALDYIDAGDHVLVPSRQRGVGAGSGVPTEIEVTTSYEVHGGRITKIVQHDTLEDAREAANG